MWERQQWEAIKLLQFLTFAERPLELIEAIDIIAVNLTETPSFYPINRMPEPLEIVEVCSSLVVLDLHDPENKRLQLAHFTVKEYLISGRMRSDLLEHFREVPAHSSIVKICLGYLESVLPSITSIWVSTPDYMNITGRDLDLGKAAWELDQLRFPLMNYAIDTWPVHARLCNQDPGTAMQIQRFFNHKSCLIKWLFCTHYPRYFPKEVHEGAKLDVSCPILLSIHLGFGEMALAMINNGLKPQSESISEDMFLFLRGGPYIIDMDAHGVVYETSDRKYFMTSHLYLATRRGMHDVVKALVERGMDIHENGGFFGTALNVACRHRLEDLTATLLQHSRDSPSQEGHEKYVQGALEMLIENWVRSELDSIVPIRDQLVQSCLIMENPGSSLDYCLKTVFFDFNLDMARTLVRKGAHVDAIARLDLGAIFDNEDFLLSFLGLFSGEESGNVDPGALQKLITAKVRPGVKSMLEEVVERGFNKVLGFMIAHGVDHECYYNVPMEQCNGHCRVLVKAVERGNTLAVQILLNLNTRAPHEDGFEDYTPSLRYMNEWGVSQLETCLHTAARWGWIEIMEALILCNADIDARNFRSQTPLHVACQFRHLEAVKLLVESGAKLHVLDSCNNTPLETARWTQNKAVVELLEQRISQINSDDSLHPKRKSETNNDDSSYTEQDSKRQKTGQIPHHPATSSRSSQLPDTPTCTVAHRTHPRTRRGAASARQ